VKPASTEVRLGYYCHRSRVHTIPGVALAQKLNPAAALGLPIYWQRGLQYRRYDVSAPSFTEEGLCMVSRPELATPRNKWKPTPTHFG